jgi:hypothetical protein
MSEIDRGGAFESLSFNRGCHRFQVSIRFSGLSKVGSCGGGQLKSRMRKHQCRIWMPVLPEISYELFKGRFLFLVFNVPVRGATNLCHVFNANLCR